MPYDQTTQQLIATYEASRIRVRAEEESRLAELRERGDLTINDRATLPLAPETISQLIDHACDYPDLFVWKRYAHDLRAKLPGDDGLAELYRWALLVDDIPELVREVWAAADRPFNPRTDSLLIDLARDLRELPAPDGVSLPEVAAMIAGAIAAERARRAERDANDQAAWQVEADACDETWVATQERQAAAHAEQFANAIQQGNVPMPVGYQPTVVAGSIPLLGNQAAAIDLGRPIIDGFIAGQQGRPANNAPSVPDTVPIAEPLSTAIGHMIAAAESAPSSFRAGAVVDALAVLAFLHEDTFKAVVARIRALGCALPEGKLNTAVAAFEVRVTREVRAGSGYRTNHKGEPDPMNADNLPVFLRLAGVEARFNVWRQRAELRWTDGEWVPLTDAELNRLRSIASGDGHRFRPSKEFFRDMLADLARQTSFDPVVDYIDAAEVAWDGKPRLLTWLSGTCGVPCDLYHQAIARNVMGGIVKRARRPGCKHDEVLILQGDQGCGKSNTAKAIALRPEWHTDSVAFEGRPQDIVPQLFGRLVIELSELDGMHRRDVGYIKRFLSTTTDNYTAKYEALASDHARRCIFIGTCNLENPLVDDTGNRRFYPVRIPRGVQIDVAWLRNNIGQLIGEAAMQESAGASFDIPREVWSTAANVQEAARSVSAVEELLLQWFTRPAVLGCSGYFVLSSDLVSALTMARQNANAKVGRVMERLGYVQRRPYINGAQLRAWVKSADGEIAECAQIIPFQNQSSGRIEMRITRAR